MKTYTIQVCMTYVQTIDVEADSQDDAEMKAFERFDLGKAWHGESECLTVAIDGESI